MGEEKQYCHILNALHLFFVNIHTNPARLNEAHFTDEQTEFLKS